MRKKAVFTILGMNRDLAKSRFDARFAYENKNLRLITDEANSQFVMTNERGPAPIKLYRATKEGYVETTIIGRTIGVCVIQNTLVLFTHLTTTDERPDRIYKLQYIGNKAVLTQLCRGNLGFDIEHPIESIACYENEKVQKVYWTDGKNQPRLINIAEDNPQYTDDSFDFAQKIDGKETISVERRDNSNGLFASGTIQYCFTYYKNYGQETNIVRISPISYISPVTRGGMNENIGCIFDIKIENLSRQFDGIRIYSIQRTSVDTTPIVRRVTDYIIPSNRIVNFSDTGTIGEDVEPTALLYLGSKEVIAQTMAQKDNTLFLGNIKEKHSVISEKLRNRLKNQAFTSMGFVNNKEIPLPPYSGYYPYQSQLSQNSRQIKYFKYGETYRFGIQLQDKFGNWSDVIRITDANNNDFVQRLRPDNSFVEELRTNQNAWLTGIAGQSNMTFAEFVANLSTAGLVDDYGESLLLDYVSIRPVVVYPDHTNRTIIAQGILCPTIYNLEDRVKYNTAGQVSWFSRPIGKVSMANPNTILNETGATRFDNLEYRHMCPIPPTNEYSTPDVLPGQNHAYASRAEIACNFDGRTSISTSSSKRHTDYTVWANLYPTKDNMMNVAGGERTRSEQLSSLFFVDQSILTFHSPELEFDRRSQVLSYEDVQMRIVGIVPITSASENVHIDLENADSDDTLYIPNYRYNNGESNSYMSKWQMSEFGGIRGDFSHRITEGGNTIPSEQWKGVMKIFPWHTKTLTYKDTTEVNDNPTLYDTIYAEGYAKPVPDTLIKTKCYDTLKYSFGNIYCVNAGLDLDIFTPNIYLVENEGILKINRDLDFTDNPMDSFYFDMNVDRSIIGKTHKYEAYDTANGPSKDYEIGFVPAGICSDITNSSMTTDRPNHYASSPNIHATEAVSMKYKTTSCALLQLKTIENAGNRYASILPFFGSINNWTAESIIHNIPNIDWRNSAPTSFDMGGSHFLWDRENTIKGIAQQDIEGCFPKLSSALSSFVGDSLRSSEIGFFYLAELYRRNVANRFGGNTDEAIAANIWTPCGEAISLRDANGNLKSDIELHWEEGDTYYQRYDNLHTYPYTFDDVNQIVDIVSFMCETRINIDGRYDNNRGRRNNESINPVNFNKLNEAYSQRDNFFQYRSIDRRRIVVEDWPDIVTWSETKTLGEITDSWAHVTLASVLEMDGVNGPVRALRTCGNNIMSFQDTAISRILYNENYAVSAENGVPLVIANSGKVSNKQYITNNIGCQNKWSIVSSLHSLYFVDDIKKDIYAMSGDGQLSSVGIKNGFGSWAKGNTIVDNVWYPGKLDGIRSLYDTNNEEILFVTSKDALSYSEVFGGFTSFYDYDNIPFLENVHGHNVMVRNGFEDTLLYEHNKGKYNNYFGKHKPFWTELICHSDGTQQDSPLLDKTWMNVGFIFDSFYEDGEYDPTDRFDSIEVSNEYQHGYTMWPSRFYPSIVKRERHWNGDLPRDEYNPTDRMRSQWLKIKLTKDQGIERENKSVIHSIDISYNE